MVVTFEEDSVNEWERVSGGSQGAGDDPFFDLAAGYMGLLVLWKCIKLCSYDSSNFLYVYYN